MRALFLQHDPGSSPGLVGEALAARGYEIDLLEMSPSIHDGAWEGAFPDPLEHDLVVPLGAIWSLYDRSQVGTWIDAELDLLRRADEGDVPVLGICFGAQALAAAHGGEVTAADRAEIGWALVHTDDPTLVPPGPWMQWHGDRFTLPPGSVEVARNDVCPQAFTLRRNLGVQFHPEVTAADVDRWVGLDPAGAEAAARAAGTTIDDVRAQCRANEDLARDGVRVLVDAFLRTIARA